jgi:putative transposase
MVDEHTRECLGGLVERNITGRHLIDELDRLAVDPGLSGRAALRPRPRARLRRDGRLGRRTRRPAGHPTGQPWRNGYIESFNSRGRDQCLNMFWSLAQARVVISDWKADDNHRRRPSALGYQAPAVYAAARPIHDRRSLTAAPLSRASAGRGRCILRAPGGPVDLDRHPAGGGSRVDQVKR